LWSVLSARGLLGAAPARGPLGEGAP
jgi:hypothetical protein